jgi:hypothetical protein
MWAILGRRSPDQRALTWHQTLASNIEFMGKVNYPRKARLRQHAAKAGVAIAFLEKQELLLRDFGNAGRLVSRAKRLGLGRLLAGLLAPFTQRYMVLIAPPGKSITNGWAGQTGLPPKVGSSPALRKPNAGIRGELKAIHASEDLREHARRPSE